VSDVPDVPTILEDVAAERHEALTAQYEAQFAGKQPDAEKAAKPEAEHATKQEARASKKAS